MSYVIATLVGNGFSGYTVTGTHTSPMVKKYHVHITDIYLHYNQNRLMHINQFRLHWGYCPQVDQ